MNMTSRQQLACRRHMSASCNNDGVANNELASNVAYDGVGEGMSTIFVYDDNSSVGRYHDGVASSNVVMVAMANVALKTNGAA